MSGNATANGKDWRSSKHIDKRARYLLDHPDEEIPSDVTFLLGDGQKEPQRAFKCHKFILAMVSSMFQSMFYGSSPQTDDVIKVPDVTPTAFRNMRRWIERNVGVVTGTLRDAFSSLLYSIRFPLFSAAELANGPITDGVLTGDEIGRLVQYLFGDVKPALPFLTAPRSSLDEPCEYFFKLVTAPADAVLGPFCDNVLQLSAFGYLAPACCAFLEHLVEERRHIRIASYDNEHVGRTLPLRAAVADERNVLSHTIKGACWFEWDMEGGVARDIRIGSGSKPGVYHSAVFGLVSGFSTYESNEMKSNEKSNEMVMFDRWDDRRIQKIANFRFL